MRTAALTLACALTLTWSETAAAQAPDALLGTWERFAQFNRAGKAVQAEFRAVLMLGADGFYSHIAVPRGAPKSTRPLSQMTMKEILDRFELVEARFGKFTISGDTLVRGILGSLDPANLGTVNQVQRFQITGDTLILRSPSPSDKAESRFRRMR